MTLIGLAGYARAGKDAAAAFLVEHHGFTRVAFADALKNIARDLDPLIPLTDEQRDLLGMPYQVVHLMHLIETVGPERAKSVPAVREFYQDLGMAVRKHIHADAWVDAAMTRADELPRCVITDVRFPNEWAAVKDRGGMIVRVMRPGITAVNAHVSEKAVDHLVEDWSIWNNGTLDDLGDAVEDMMATLGILWSAPIAAVKHPAKFSEAIIGVLNGVVADEAEFSERRLRVLDPMAGTGRIHEMDSRFVYETHGVELEPEWATMHPRTVQGDATALEWPDSEFDAVITSPAYGNRMADHHDARDDSRRMTYKHQLGRDLSPNSGAGLQWSDAYRDLHKKILAEMVRVTRPDGIVVVNISNHIRKGVEQYVSEWWLARMLLAGLKFERAIPVTTPRMRFGENHAARVDCEWVFVARKS